MRRPNSLLKGTELEAYLTKEQEYHQHALTKHISRYEKKCFIENLKELIRTIEEFINLQLEIDNDEDLQLFLAFDNSNFSFSISQINVICNRLEKQFDQGVINRLKSIMLMNIALYNGYKISGMHESIYQKIKDNKHAILYYQSNRKNYIDLLTLGYNYCQGKIKFPFIDTLNQIQYTVDTCFGCIINAYYNRLSYYCLDNFSIDYSFDPYKASYHFENLDNLYLEPQRLGLIEQGEFTSALENYIPKKNKRNELIFDFVEVYIALELLEVYYQKYNIEQNIYFFELKFLSSKVEPFCRDNYHIEVPIDFYELYIMPYIKENNLIAKYPINLYSSSNEIFCFWKEDKIYYSNINLLTRYIYNTTMTRLGASKRFQINSGFVFENMVSKLLLDYKFKLTNIKRINRKEFDIVAIFANKIYNFQCKNIFIDISRVQSNPNAMARLNKRIVSYLKRAYTKEVSREQLILNEVGNLPINHIVVTRFPVITIEKYIINFNKLGEYLYTVVNMPHNGHPAC